VAAGETSTLVHNCGGKRRSHSSQPAFRDDPYNPDSDEMKERRRLNQAYYGAQNRLPKEIQKAYKAVKSGNGNPRMTGNSQTIRQGIENPEWAGALEWNVPRADGTLTSHRILSKNGRLGYAFQHDYKKVFDFPGPWYEEQGPRPRRVWGDEEW
jgi:hypothetical protein